MDDGNLWEKVSSKYILKKIFSLMKVPKALNVIKLNKEIKEKLDITLFHYQYCYFCIFFKNEKIETIYDIINSPYLKIFPENVKYELIFKYIETKKLFKNDYIYLNFDNISLIQKLKEKKYLNYLIGNFEELKYDIDIESNYHNNIKKMIEIDINNIDKILYDYKFFVNNELTTNINYQNIKYISINLDEFCGNAFDISLFNNLEYLSLSLNSRNEFIIKNEIKIIFSENQYKTIKTLKIIESKEIYCTIQSIIFETVKNNENKCFENLKELHIKEKLLNQIKLNPKNLQKLNIIYDYRDTLYTIEYIKNSLFDMIQKYPLLNDLNITFYHTENETNSLNYLIKEITDFLFNLIPDIENLSLSFYYVSYGNGFFECLFKKIPNRKSKYIFRGYIPYDIIESFLDKIEEINLSQNFCYFYNKTCNLAIEEKSSISSITKIKINSVGDKNLYIPIKSFNSLNVLDLDLRKINFYIDFPLFIPDSKIIFNNLEYLSLKTEEIDIINKLIDNFNTIPNLRFLSIIIKNIINTILAYHKDIFDKCKILKRLHTLIMDDIDNSILKEVNDYYTIYPELKNTNIKFCAFPNELLNKGKL